ncbi:helix-turn-helix domain-containing protein [Brevibacterium sp. ZH18]|uniref:helix-turn-helix transcriptional regulator n=1 Tax=Brevibacterium sp. ZH18 TaxID=2927784 RepID=UPI001F61FF71|nr:helix-turn-helix domain-containing protein [Brevibacterium sp. ZH18]MCI4010030.1 helix-turn-helix domain-containing protein [Brevibacterium sp. ZH18]
MKPLSDSLSAKDESRTQRRADVLRAIRSSRSPVGVNGLAADLGVHPNTVRFHLRSLEAEGQIVRGSAGVAHGPGRPAVTYQSVPDESTEHQRADLLAHILLSEVDADAQPFERARAAGVRWGRAEAVRRQGTRKDATTDPPATANVNSRAIGELIDVLDDAGFAPTAASADTIDLLHCPLKEFVAAHGRTACAVHEGMMRGFLDETDAPASVRALQPFASPGVCRTTLEQRSEVTVSSAAKSP